MALMAQSRSNAESDLPSRYERIVVTAAVVFTVLAVTLFVIILIFGGLGATQMSRLFSPIAIGATVLGLVGSIAAITYDRTRFLGITTTLVLVPCALLSALGLVALFS